MPQLEAGFGEKPGQIRWPRQISVKRKVRLWEAANHVRNPWIAHVIRLQYM
jgi:hypothetical protein